MTESKLLDKLQDQLALDTDILASTREQRADLKRTHNFSEEAVEICIECLEKDLPEEQEEEIIDQLRELHNNLEIANKNAQRRNKELQKQCSKRRFQNLQIVQTLESHYE